jgi:hypothetical protein
MACFCCAVFEQTKQETQTKKMLEAAANNGKTVPTDMTVKHNVNAQAVLIPQTDARRIFGKEIADHYAVIEVNVGNKSPDAALIIHGIFIDYSGWAMSGSVDQGQPTTIASAPGKPFDLFQSSTSPNQVASEEYRIVRDQLQNARLYSGRSWTMRALELAADIATAYPFGLSARELKYFGVFSGNLVPGIEKLWPEETEAQLLRISDYGYRTNKVIPKESAEIVVCFFPIGRFLTPGFAHLFLKKPALFFAPLQMFADKTLKKETASLLNTIDSKLDLDDLARAMPCYVRIVRETDFGANAAKGSLREQVSKAGIDTCLHRFGLTRDTDGKIDLMGAPNCISETTEKAFGNFLALDFISHMSLNSITVTVDGAMTVDTSSLVPKIDSVKFDSVDPCGSDEMPCFWSDLTVQSGTRTGAILGSYLTNGTIEIVDAKEKDLGLTELKTVPEGSSDQVLNFSFKLTKPIPAGTTIHFKVTKPVMGVAALSTNSLESKLLEYVVLAKDQITVSVSQFVETTPPPTPPTWTLTLTSEAFATAPSTMTFNLHPPSGADVPLLVDSTVVDPKSKNVTAFVFKIQTSKLTPFGCWKVVVSIDKEPVRVLDLDVAPTITKATLDTSEATKKIKIEGVGLNNVDSVTGNDCQGNAPSFAIVNTDSKSFPLVLEKPVPTDGTSLKFTLPLPATSADKTWTVKVTFNGKDVPIKTNLH